MRHYFFIYFTYFIYLFIHLFVFPGVFILSVTHTTRASNGNSILTFFSVSRLILESYEPKNFFGYSWEGLQNFIRNMKGEVLFPTRCMNMKLLEMFNWYIFKLFSRVRKFIFIKILCTACFC